MESDRNATATKGDLQDLRNEILTATKDDLQNLKDELLEAFRDGQTEMLRAFYSFAQSADVKFKETELDDIMLRQRLTAMESRLTEVEKRLHLPPAA